MLIRTRSKVAQYGFCVVAVALATLLRYALQPVLDERGPFILYFPTVVLCAWFGGLWPGLLSTALGGAIAWYVFIPPYYSLAYADPTVPAQLIVFLLAGALISALAESLHTARRRTEESEVREREAREELRVTLASIGDAVITTDAGGRVNFMNEVAQSLTGWKNEEAKGRPLGEVFRIVNQDTRKAVENPALRAMQEGRIVGLANHTLLVARDGTEIPIDDSGAPIKNPDGTVIGAVLIFRDITERRRAEDKFRLAIDGSPIAKIMVDRTGRIVLANVQAERLFGYSREELIGQPVEKLVPQRFRARHPEYREGFAAAPQTRPMGAGRDLYGLRKDGTEVPIEIGLNPIGIDGEKLVLSAIVDLTERKRAEHSLTERARQQAALYRFVARLHRAESLAEVYEAALDAMLEALGCDRASILLFDDAGVMRFVAWRGLSDDYRRGVEGHSPWKRDDADAQPLCEPDAAVSTLDEHLKAVLKGEGIGALAFIPLAAGGRLIGKLMTYYNTPHVFGDVELDLSLSIARQLALSIERKRGEDAVRTSEQRLRLALDAGRMGSWEWNVRTGEVIWSPELEAIHGLRPGGFGGSFTAYKKDVHPADWEVIERSITRGFETGDHHVEYRIIRPDGAVRWVEGRGKVFRDETGAPARVVGVCTDVTERKRAEEALREADRHKDEFLAMLSHELRNPLAALASAAHVLAVADPTAENAAQARGVIARQTELMTRLIEDLLDVSRVIMGKMVLERSTFDLAEMVTNVVQAWRAAGRLAGAQLSLSSSPAWVHADRIRIEQVFSNLLDNALKFTPAGKDVTVSVRSEKGQAVLQISDKGEGIAPDLLAHVFDVFVQGQRLRHRNKGGLGLGLALVKRLAVMHGGTVEAASEGSGRGAVFTVRLPAVPSPRVQPATPLVVHPPGGRRILIVDDNDDARQMLEAVLALGGHTVQAARDGKSGLALAADWSPDVALIDIGLPDIDGYEVARRLRAAPAERRIALVALTGFGQAEDQRRAFAAGFDAHLTKPVTADELSQAIADLR